MTLISITCAPNPLESDTKTASIITPNPPSPNKKRKTNAKTSLCIDMDDEFVTTLTEKIIFLTWDEIHSLHVEDVKNYMTTYAKLNDQTITEAMFKDTHFDDLRESLLVNTLELH